VGTKNTIYLISGGVNYYLSGGAPTQTPYNGSGTPWTSEATTPYELSLNDATGSIYVPQPAPVQTTYSGGPPFMNNRVPVTQSYDTIIESVGIQLKATDGAPNAKDNAISLLRQLRQILNTALYSRPCVLVIQGGTNAGYYEVLAADVPENALYLSEPDGHWRATITWTRTAHATKSSLDTLLNAVTFTNIGDTSNNDKDFLQLGTINGDLASSGNGQPMRVTLDTPSTSGAFVGYVSVAKSRLYDAVATAISTTSTSGVDVTGTQLTNISDDEATSIRFIGRFASPSSNLEVQAVASINGAQTIYSSEWFLTGTANGTYIDFGYIKLPRNLRRGKAVTIQCTIRARSTNGASATATLSYIEIVQYYTWLKIPSITFISTSYQIDIVGADSSVGGYVREIAPEFAYLSTGGTATAIVPTIGTFPRAYAGAGLYLAWTWAGIHTTTATFDDVTAQSAALYQTVRGNG